MLFQEEIDAILAEMSKSLPIGNHICDYIKYIGLNEVFEYCRICDKKRETKK